MIYNNSIKKKIHQYFLQFGLKDYYHGWMRGNCPYCNKDFTFGVHIENNNSNCFKCGPKGNLPNLIMDLEKINTWAEFLNFIQAFEESTLLKGDYIIYEQEEEEKEVKLPEGFKLLKFGKSQVSKSIRNYVKSRGFDIEELSLKGVGYCDRGEYFGHLIIPYHKAGKLIYFNARNVLNTGPKFKNPRLEDFNIGKNSVAYNIDALFIYNKVFLVESATNALTLGERAIALGGKTISSNIRSLIINSPVRRLSFFFDLDDDLDAIYKAIKEALELVHFKKVKVVIPPDQRDVNDLGREKALEIEKSFNYLSHSELLELKFQYEEPQLTY